QAPGDHRRPEGTAAGRPAGGREGDGAALARRRRPAGGRGQGEGRGTSDEGRGMKRCRIVLAAVLLLPGAAAAHDLGADCKLVGGPVGGQGFFPDNERATAAGAGGLEEGGRVVAEGRPDEKGVWRFDRPADGHYTVRVDAGDGHLKKVT